MFRYLSVYILLITFSCSYLKKENTQGVEAYQSVSEDENIPSWRYSIEDKTYTNTNGVVKVSAFNEQEEQVPFARFPEQISSDYMVDSKKVFAYGVDYNRQLAATMERTIIGSEYTIYLYDYAKNEKVKILDQSSLPQIKHAVKPIAFLSKNELFNLTKLRFPR